MGFRFRKSIKIAPGVRLNVGTKSVGISAGVKGARISTNTRTGTRATVGIPNTGLSYSQKVGGTSKRRKSSVKAQSHLFTGYVIECGICQSRLELPPFSDPATVFCCSACQSTMQLSPELQAQLVSPHVVQPATWLPSAPTPNKAISTPEPDPIVYCSFCNARNDLDNPRFDKTYNCSLCSQPFKLRPKVVRPVQPQIQAQSHQQSTTSAIGSQSSASSLGFGILLFLGGLAFTGFLLWLTG